MGVMCAQPNLHALVSDDLAKLFADAVSSGDKRIIRVSIENGKK